MPCGRSCSRGAAAALTSLTFPAIGTLAAQQDTTVKLLQELTNANGAPGFEGPVRTILKREWQGILTDLRTDGLGNLLGSLPGGSESPRVLVMAHMDEVGFMVRYIDPNGFVYFHPIGTYIDQAVLTQRFTIMTPTGPVVGYTGVKSPHIVPPEERNSMVQATDMFLDLGVKSRDEAEKLGVRPGLPMTYRTEFEVFNSSTNRYLAKAFDDRVGCALITEALQQFRSLPHPEPLQVAATVQEDWVLEAPRSSTTNSSRTSSSTSRSESPAIFRFARRRGCRRNRSGKARRSLSSRET